MYKVYFYVASNEFSNIKIEPRGTFLRGQNTETLVFILCLTGCIQRSAASISFHSISEVKVTRVQVFDSGEERDTKGYK